MQSRALTRVIALILGLLLTGLVIFGFTFMKRQLSKPAQVGAAQQPDTDEAPGGSVSGPFILRLTYPKIGGQSYISFHVYYHHEGTDELWYSCGRMFPANDVSSIDWTGAQHDIAVQMKDGSREVFSYDGNNNWQ